MNAFEDVVSTIFKRNRYWTQINYKLKLDPKEKKAIGKKTIPTIDIDIVAYRPGEILWIECKSYLGSDGVDYKALRGKGKGASRYKMFTNDKYRGVLLPALKNDLRRRGMTKGKNKIRLWLVAGKVAGGDRNEEEIKNLFKKKKWDFMGPKTLRENLKNIVVKDKNVWDDNVTHVVTKLLIGE